MKTKLSTRIISIAFAVLFAATAFMIPVSAANNITVFRQNGNNPWSNYGYGKYIKNNKWESATISTSGCALLALTNAVYWLNGSFLEPTMLADFSLENGTRINNVGTTGDFVKKASAEFGSEYKFKYVKATIKESDLKSALQNDQTAVWHCPGHFMAIVDYNSQTNKYLILDSYPSSNRGTANGGYAWKTFGQIKKMGITSFHILSKTSSARQNISWPTLNGIQAYPVSTRNDTIVYKTSTSSAKYGTLYATDLCTLLGYENGRLKIQYPVTNARGKVLYYKVGYVNASSITSVTPGQALYSYIATSKITTYRRAGGGSTMGYIAKGDRVYVITSNNGWTQVLYPIANNKYKLAWIKATFA